MPETVLHMAKPAGLRFADILFLLDIWLAVVLGVVLAIAIVLFYKETCTTHKMLWLVITVIHTAKHSAQYY